jgi:two-component system response regulator AauR
VAVDCRVIAGEVRPRRLEQGRQFRSDLYYRLNVVTLELPPLRERREDILQLFEHFCSSRRCALTARTELDNQTLSNLMSHDWPGNVRELRNVAERFASACRPSRNPAPARQSGLAFAEAVEAFERNLLSDALQRSGNLTARPARNWAWPRPRCSTK